jgi:3-phenylpropionate/cinnamic acid dioxygenase small subunit
MNDDTEMSDDERRLARLKAEQKARTQREKQLHTLIESSQSSLEDRIAAFKTVAQTDQARFASAISKMLKKPE